MKVVVILVVGLSLAACEHMYGAMEGGRLTDTLAIRLARQEASRHDISLRGLEPAVARFDTGTGVSFDTPECSRSQSCLDGGPYFFIDTGKRHVTYVRSAY